MTTASWEKNWGDVYKRQVQSMTMLFLQMWNVTETRAENYKAYRTQMRTGFDEKNGFVIPYGDSPYDNENVGEEVYFNILNNAKKYVHIMTPYLIIDNAVSYTPLDVYKRQALYQKAGGRPYCGRLG